MASRPADDPAARFRRAEQLFDEASALDSAARAAFLTRACDGDDALRREVDALLAAAPAAEELFDRAPDPRVGDVVGRWRLKQRIGAGGMGVVYRAERADGEFAQTVAVKFLRASFETDEARARFLRERQVLARLSHPAIARLIDGGTDEEGLPYLVMELVDGVHLDEWCDARRLPLAPRLALFRAVCAAVEFAHRCLVVHRDLKPSNVLVTQDGSNGRDGTVKLLDFGIARVLEPGVSGDRTHTLDRRFTPDYASPEIVRGELATTSADVFSLGVILYELLTGRRPHATPTQTPAAIERAICETIPPLPSAAPIAPEAAAARATTVDALRAELRGDLDAIVAVALAKEPERRYPSVERLSEDVRRVLAGEAVAARRPGRSERLWRWVRRERALAATGAAALLLLIGGGAATTVAWVEASRQAAAARQKVDTTGKVNRLLRSLLLAVASGTAMARDEALPVELANAARDLDRGLLRDDPAVEAELRTTLGATWTTLGRPREAIAQLARACELDQRALGGDAPVTLRTEVAHANAIRDGGDYAASERMLREVIARCEASGRDSAELALALESLGDVLIEDARFDEAVAPLRRCLAHREALGPRGSFGIASALNALGSALTDAGQAAEAEPLLHRSLAIRRAETTGWRIAVGLESLGACLTRLGRFDAADEALAEGLALRRRIMDPDHPEIAAMLSRLGALHRESGRLADAETEFREALRIVRARLPARHPKIVKALLDLGDLLVRRGRGDETRAFVDEALAIAQSAGCDDAHPLVRRARTLQESAR